MDFNDIIKEKSQEAARHGNGSEWDKGQVRPLGGASWDEALAGEDAVVIDVDSKEAHFKSQDGANKTMKFSDLSSHRQESSEFLSFDEPMVQENFFGETTMNFDHPINDLIKERVEERDRKMSLIKEQMAAKRDIVSRITTSELRHPELIDTPFWESYVSLFETEKVPKFSLSDTNKTYAIDFNAKEKELSAYDLSEVSSDEITYEDFKKLRSSRLSDASIKVDLSKSIYDSENIGKLADNIVKFAPEQSQEQEQSRGRGM